MKPKNGYIRIYITRKRILMLSVTNQNNHKKRSLKIYDPLRNKYFNWIQMTGLNILLIKVE